MADYKAFTKILENSHRYAVVLDIVIGFKMINSQNTVRLKTRALIDTGANMSCISSRVAFACKLKTSAYVKMLSVNGKQSVPVHKVDLHLSNDIEFKDILVMEFAGGSDFDVIIGMDILNKCDIALTNANDETCFTLRTPPSNIRLDFSNI